MRFLGLLVAMAVAAGSFTLLHAFTVTDEGPSSFARGALAETGPPVQRSNVLATPRWLVEDASFVTETVATRTPVATPTYTPTQTPTATLTPEPTATPIPPTPVPATVEPAPPPPPPAPEPEPVYVEPAPAPEPVYNGGGDWTSIVCSYGWSCDEALNVIYRESGGDAWAVNPSSGACGLFQLYPCVAYGDVWTQTAIAWEKYVACGGGSFQCAWYNWW